jgi:hypothetical protein
VQKELQWDIELQVYEEDCPWSEWKITPYPITKNDWLFKSAFAYYLKHFTEDMTIDERCGYILVSGHGNISERVREELKIFNPFIAKCIRVTFNSTCSKVQCVVSHTDGDNIYQYYILSDLMGELLQYFIDEDGRYIGDFPDLIVNGGVVLGVVYEDD